MVVADVVGDVPNNKDRKVFSHFKRQRHFFSLIRIFRRSFIFHSLSENVGIMKILSQQKDSLTP